MRKVALDFRRIRKPMFVILAALWVFSIGVIVANQFPAGVVYQSVTFNDVTGQNVDAEVIRPAVLVYGTEQPVVVLVHGFAISKQFFYSLGVEFALQGFVTISISMD
jgi:cephalosporin-C deacetylase-like acetyl esterase